MAKKRKGSISKGTHINISLHVGDHIPPARMQAPDESEQDFRPSPTGADFMLDKLIKDKGGRTRAPKKK